MSLAIAVRNTDDVPRRPPHSAGPDEWAAWRVARERERHGWTQTELARLVTEAGAPIRQQTVWEIENREPPRRISVSEALAFCEVFGIDPAGFGAPPEEVVGAHLTEAKDERERWRAQAKSLIDLLRGSRIQPPPDPATYQAMLADVRDVIHSVRDVADELLAELDADREDTDQ